ncbi:MAG: type II toxin-antitoxin system ParD family antitoxin [Pseudomonadota bacterium]
MYLTDQQDDFGRHLVAEGRYASASAVIQKDLDLLQHQTEAEMADTVALKAILAERTAELPFQVTLHPDILPDVRFVRRNNAVFWFRPEADAQIVRVLALFFGAQDHIRHMMARMLDRKVPR